MAGGRKPLDWHVGATQAKGRQQSEDKRKVPSLRYRCMDCGAASVMP